MAKCSKSTPVTKQHLYLNHGIFPQLFSMPSVHQRRVSSYHLFIELQILSCWNFLCSICLILLTTHAMGWLFSQRSFKFIQGINDAVNVSEAHLIVWIPWTLPEGSLLVLAPCTVKCITPHCPAGPPRTFATTCFVSISSFHYWRFGEMKLASSLFYLLLMGTSIILLNPGNIPWKKILHDSLLEYSYPEPPAESYFIAIVNASPNDLSFLPGKLRATFVN